MKSIIVKPNFVEVGEKDITIRITDENEIQFIKSHLNNDTLGFHLNSIENVIEEKKESISVIQTDTDNDNVLIPLNQIQSYYKEYQSFIVEKQTMLLKLKEIEKQIEHSQMNSFNDYCCNLLNVKVVSHLCEYCKVNRYPTIKSLSAHQRKCKLNVIPVPIENETKSENKVNT